MMYDVTVFENFRFRLSTQKREACVFKNLQFGERFWKDMFLVTVFTRLGQTGEKNFRLQTKTVSVERVGLLNFNNNLNNCVLW